MNVFHLKLILHMLVALKYFPLINKDDRQRWIEFCIADYSNCANCFDGDSMTCCFNYLDDVSLPTSFATDVSNVFGSRKIQHGLYNQQKVVLKYLVNEENFDDFKKRFCVDTIDCDKILKDPGNKDILKTKLQSLFENMDSKAGFQICPTDSVVRFMEVFSTMNTYDWILLNFNVEPLIVNTLYVNNFSVPQLHASCGFVTIQSDNGLPLYEFYDKSFDVRLLIAKNLLEAAIQFSIGIKGFRIYLTDATPDNICVDSNKFTVTFVDLDGVFVVDSEAVTNDPRVHRHEKIDCEGNCFAYVPQELCSYYLSDINLFAICQLFVEDFRRYPNKGLLHSIPDLVSNRYPELKILLDSCIDCSYTECDNRFEISKTLVNLFNVILKDS